MIDFNLDIYTSLLLSLKKKGYKFSSLESYLANLNDSYSKNLLIILRHDVDRKSQYALKIAQLENSLGIKGTYYFRIVPESYNLKVTHQIANLGHEMGYHYEDVDLASKKYKVKSKKDEENLIDAAYESFCRNLEMLRKDFDIKTICMHGSPKSEYDNKLIWTKYDYKQLGIIGEPYLDIDWNEWAYLTDTGRRWNGNKVSVRDKVNSRYNFDFRTTHEIIANIDKLPDKIMFTIHPQRWNDKFLPWVKELVSQNIKNVVKRIVVKRGKDY